MSEIKFLERNKLIKIKQNMLDGINLINKKKGSSRTFRYDIFIWWKIRTSCKIEEIIWEISTIDERKMLKLLKDDSKASRWNS